MGNSNASASASSSGIGVFGLTFIALLVFKLAGMAGVSWGLANMSWWWVFAPLIAGFALWLLVMTIVVILALVVGK